MPVGGSSDISETSSENKRKAETATAMHRINSSSPTPKADRKKGDSSPGVSRHNSLSLRAKLVDAEVRDHIVTTSEELLALTENAKENVEQVHLAIEKLHMSEAKGRGYERACGSKNNTVNKYSILHVGLNDLRSVKSKNERNQKS